MLVSFVDWAINREGIRFRWFGPLNETDLGSPEGPTVSPVEYVRVLEVLHDKLQNRGLNDLRFIVPEQASFNTDYIRELVKSEKLRERIGVEVVPVELPHGVIAADVGDGHARNLGWSRGRGNPGQGWGGWCR